MEPPSRIWKNSNSNKTSNSTESVEMFPGFPANSNSTEGDIIVDSDWWDSEEDSEDSEVVSSDSEVEWDDELDDDTDENNDSTESPKAIDNSSLKENNSSSASYSSVEIDIEPYLSPFTHKSNRNSTERTKRSDEEHRIQKPSAGEEHEEEVLKPGKVPIDEDVFDVPTVEEMLSVRAFGLEQEEKEEIVSIISKNLNRFSNGAVREFFRDAIENSFPETKCFANIAADAAVPQKATADAEVWIEFHSHDMENNEVVVALVCYAEDKIREDTVVDLVNRE